eukprot:s3644_g3.t2
MADPTREAEDFDAWEEQQKAERRRAAQAELAEFHAQRQRELEAQARREERAKEAARSRADAVPAAAAGGYAPAPAVPDALKALMQACGSSQEYSSGVQRAPPAASFLLKPDRPPPYDARSVHRAQPFIQNVRHGLPLHGSGVPQ